MVNKLFFGAFLLFVLTTPLQVYYANADSGKDAKTSTATDTTFCTSGTSSTGITDKTSSEISTKATDKTSSEISTKASDKTSSETTDETSAEKSTTISTSTSTTTSTTLSSSTTSTIGTTLSPNRPCSRCGELIADPFDCSMFKVCTLDASGNLIEQRSQCENPDVPYFDESKQGCTTSYKHCVNTTSSTFSAPECDCSGVAADPEDKKRYYLCAAVPYQRPIKKHRVCLPGTSFNETAQFCNCDDNKQPPCMTSYSSTPPADCIQPGCDYHPLDENSNCTEEGNFPDKHECDRYHMCVKEECGKFMKYSTTCPLFTKYDYISKKCVSDDKVKCPCTTRETTFQCPGNGVYKDPNCTTQYFVCYTLTQFKFWTKRLSCPGGTIYDPVAKNCKPTTQKPNSGECSSHSESTSEEKSYLKDSSSDESNSVGYHNNKCLKGICKKVLERDSHKENKLNVIIVA